MFKYSSFEDQIILRQNFLKKKKKTQFVKSYIQSQELMIEFLFY